MYKFYFTITFKEGCKLGGHNCTDFEIANEFLIVKGYDVIGNARRYYKFQYELSDIKEFHIERMVEKEEYYD